MPAFSFVFAFALVLATPSVADMADTGLPGVGAFAYTGSPIVAQVPQVAVASR